MQLIEARKLLVLIKRADNEMRVLLNGQQVHYVRTDGDPDLNVRVDFDVPYGLNSLVIIGVNWGGPSHFAYRLLADGVDRDEADERPGNSAGVLLVKQYLVANPDHPPINPVIS